MPPSGKNAAAPKDRRKSNATAASITTSLSPIKPSLIVSLKTTPKRLRAIVDPDSVKEETPVRELKESPATSTTLPAAPNSNTENASDSTPNTPAGTPAAQPSIMGPPADGPKKKGVKRGAGAAAIGNGEPKVRGKPGPKKKQRLEDGTIEGGRGGGLAAHKLGPKANQGAINAGLRALDRSGKPCRKWAKGGLTLKSFTGVVWEIPRWVAPPKPRPESSIDDSTPASAEGSSKENKEDNSQVKSDASNNGADVEMQSAPSVAAANSPAPFAVAAA
ncbi:INO80 complex, subunit Ies4 [Lasiosphaeria miniovina]|uniref:INO80 complex, subunit Ies4 n=1 Tax=Lasiosphaeria miniovina TaxID=1954250 RepID=A0AA40B693_9PEZI|nr:INO80 complex, subunit Ies4 [Lasiosphaeria miniovina]KAK0728470.1 INO80 complex, subunit Ies4 [Lasiosphaeria miniovina]